MKKQILKMSSIAILGGLALTSCMEETKQDTSETKVETSINQEKESNMKARNLEKTKVMNASAENVWREVSKMDNIHELTQVVGNVDWTGNKGVGGIRTCTTPDGTGKFKEEIKTLNDNEMSYTWAVVEGVPAKNMVNGFKVEDLGNGKSELHWHSTFEFIENPQMTQPEFEGFLTSTVDEMMGNIEKMAQ